MCTESFRTRYWVLLGPGRGTGSMTWTKGGHEGKKKPIHGEPGKAKHTFLAHGQVQGAPAAPRTRQPAFAAVSGSTNWAPWGTNGTCHQAAGPRTSSTAAAADMATPRRSPPTTTSAEEKGVTAKAWEAELGRGSRGRSQWSVASKGQVSGDWAGGVSRWAVVNSVPRSGRSRTTERRGVKRWGMSAGGVTHAGLPSGKPKQHITNHA